MTAFVFPAMANASDLPDDRDRTLPCRPTIACTADLVPPGTSEIEAGYLFRQIGSHTRQWSFPVLAKLTLAWWAQVQVGSNGYVTSRGDAPSNYLDDVTAAMKFHFVDQATFVPSLSASAEASLPTFAGQLGYLRTYDALFTAYVTKDFGPVHADWNVGFNEWRFTDKPLEQSFTALAVSVTLPAPFVVMGEGYYFSDAAPVALRDGGFLFALSHSPCPWLVFDVGGDVGFFPTSRSYSVFLGVSFIPVVFWRP